MLIVCKTCSSSYHIPREIFGDSGCQLRCVGCGETWSVTPEELAIDSAPLFASQEVGHDPWRQARYDFRRLDISLAPGVTASPSPRPPSFAAFLKRKARDAAG